MGTKNVLITGSEGQLGRSILSYQDEFLGLKLIPSDIGTLDITDETRVKKFFSTLNIDYVVNCSAFTAVDDAEKMTGPAFAVNHKGPENLASACIDKEIPIIHISTDYVFSGELNRPYTENDPTGPVTVYGRSKLAGESSLLGSGISGLIIRTSWLFSEYGNNFVKSILSLGEKNEEIRVVFDQTGSPTYAGDLAKAILLIITEFSASKSMPEPLKIYHYCNHGVCSWYDLALAVIEMKKINCRVQPVTSVEFPRPAPRPFYSVLNNQSIRNKFGIVIPHWRSSLYRCLQNLP